MANSRKPHPWRLLAWSLTAVFLLAGLMFQQRLKNLASGLYARATNATIADRLEQYGPAARARLRPDFLRASVAYPPSRLTLIAFKAEKRLELWTPAVATAAAPACHGAAEANQSTTCWVHLHTWPILASTGHAGPKLRQGDRQTPEGFYQIESLNPASLYHLALRVNYPNADDCRRAAQDGRPPGSLGGDIMIHGMAVSIGCIAIGDAGIEELFVLAADCGIENIDLIVAPCDLRIQPPPSAAKAGNPWVADLYLQLAAALRIYRQPAASAPTLAVDTPSASPPTAGPTAP